MRGELVYETGEPDKISHTARIYLDESKLFEQPRREENNHEKGINQTAVNKYKEYFSKMMQHNTFQLELNNGNEYYVFSNTDTSEWIETATKKSVVQATKYLDKIYMENLTVHSITSIADVTETVREQYKGQKELIFNSYNLVNQIMDYRDTEFVQMMIDYVVSSRESDESRRRLWRIVNEQYYGLDIHPLMEYEEVELQKILYYCENPDEQKKLRWRPILKKGAISAAGVIAGWAAYGGIIK